MNKSTDTARAAIFAKLHSALGRGPLDAPHQAALAARSAQPPRHPRPRVEGDLLARFISKLESRAGTTGRVAHLAEVPAAVEAYGQALGLPRRAVVGGTLAGLAWPAGWALHGGAAEITDSLSVTPCLAGIAETGSLLLISGPANPTSHHFVPENHVVILELAHLVAHLEDAWAALTHLPAGLPRAVNIVSGPSRTADVEQTIQLGAHGPRRLHVLLVGQDPAPRV